MAQQFIPETLISLGNAWSTSSRKAVIYDNGNVQTQISYCELHELAKQVKLHFC